MVIISIHLISIISLSTEELCREKSPMGFAAAMIMLVIYRETENVFLLFQLFKQVLPVWQVIIILWNFHNRKVNTALPQTRSRCWNSGEKWDLRHSHIFMQFLQLAYPFDGYIVFNIIFMSFGITAQLVSCLTWILFNLLRHGSSTVSPTLWHLIPVYWLVWKLTKH